MQDPAISRMMPGASKARLYGGDMNTMTRTQALRRLLKENGFIYMPVAYDALGGRLVADTGFTAVYNGGFVTGGTRCTSEPLLTMDEQVRVAGDVANAVAIPVVADGGAGFGEPLHTMRTVREFIRAGVAGIHIEDQLYPKRAHYHKYVAHAIPREEFADKIKFACRARDESDRTSSSSPAPTPAGSKARRKRSRASTWRP